MTIKEAAEMAKAFPQETKDELIAQLLISAKHYEMKLIELMGEKEFEKFATEVAKKMFMGWVEELPDSDFRNFAFDNFEEITK